MVTRNIYKYILACSKRYFKVFLYSTQMFETYCKRIYVLWAYLKKREFNKLSIVCDRGAPRARRGLQLAYITSHQSSFTWHSAELKLAS